MQEPYTSEINLKELIEIENSLQEEPCSLETLNVVNAKLVQVIKDSATEAGVPHEVEKSEKETNFGSIENIRSNEHFMDVYEKSLRENDD